MGTGNSRIRGRAVVTVITVCSPTATTKDVATAIRWARLRQPDFRVTIYPYEAAKPI
jgi:hypothetical protein